MTEQERTLELIGTPEDVQAMLNAASRVEPRIFKKKRINPGHYVLWYRAKEPPNDLVAAIKRRAGLTTKRKSRARKVEPVEQVDSD